MAEVKGGDRAVSVLADIGRSLSPTGGTAFVKVGFLEGATYPDGTTVAEVAAYNEWGVPSRGQSPRPFFRNMIADHQGEWGDNLAKILASNGENGPNALALMGELIKGQLAQSIRDTNDPPLAPSTVAAKGFEKPLIDTGHMWNSIDYIVEE